MSSSLMDTCQPARSRSAKLFCDRVTSFSLIYAPSCCTAILTVMNNNKSVRPFQEVSNIKLKVVQKHFTCLFDTSRCIAFLEFQTQKCTGSLFVLIYWLHFDLSTQWGMSVLKKHIFSEQHYKTPDLSHFIFFARKCFCPFNKKQISF